MAPTKNSTTATTATTATTTPQTPTKRNQPKVVAVVEQPSPEKVPNGSPPETVVQIDAPPKVRNNRRMSRAIREQVVANLDSVMERIIPLFKTPRKSKDAQRPETPAVVINVKDVLREVHAELKTIRSSLRVRIRKAGGGDRKTSKFNVFVKDTMRDLKERGIVFPTTTERMKECGRLWSLHKEATALAEAVVVA